MTADCRQLRKWNFLLACMLSITLAVFSSATMAAESVARAVFTSQIVDREPVDEITSLPNTSDKIYFFSDLRGLEGLGVGHRQLRLVI